MDSNQARIDYLIENFARIQQAVKDAQVQKQFKPVCILLSSNAGPGTIAVMGLQELKTLLKSVKRYGTLKKEIEARMNTYFSDPLVLVEAGGGILRTTLGQAQLRYDMKDVSNVEIIGGF